jgi:hypothetical protein
VAAHSSERGFIHHDDLVKVLTHYSEAEAAEAFPAFSHAFEGYMEPEMAKLERRI